MVLEPEVTALKKWKIIEVGECYAMCDECQLCNYNTGGRFCRFDAERRCNVKFERVEDDGNRVRLLDRSENSFLRASAFEKQEESS